jgi:hypothetical protein
MSMRDDLLLTLGPDGPVRSVLVGAHWTTPPLLGIERCLPGFHIRTDVRSGCYARRSQA